VGDCPRFGCTLGNRSIGSIRRTDIQGLIKAKSLELAPTTIRNVNDAMARLFAAAVMDRAEITSSPCVKIKLPPLLDEEIVPPTPDEVRALVDGMDEQFRALVVFLAGSGLRISEALGLEIADIDFLRRSVRVERQLLQSGKFAPPKTTSSRRTVPLGQVVIDEMAAHLARVGADGPLWPAQTGERLQYGRWKKEWDSSRKPLRLEFTAHDLRHHAASLLISGGASVQMVSSFLGHKEATVTLRYCSHLFHGDEDRPRAIMDVGLAPPKDKPRTADVQEG
jgi:integrase